MGVAITFLLSLMIILLSFFTLGRQMIVSYGNVSDSWTTLRKLSVEKADTKLTGPIGLSVSATSTVEMILANEGGNAIGRFADWNVIFEVQKASGEWRTGHDIRCEVENLDSPPLFNDEKTVRVPRWRSHEHRAPKCVSRPCLPDLFAPQIHGRRSG